MNIGERMQAEAQQIADDTWRFTLPELSAVAAVYGIDTTGLRVGELRSLIATKRAAYCRPQAVPVVMCADEDAAPITPIGQAEE